MADQFCFVPTGEVRHPKEGEVYEDAMGGLRLSDFDWKYDKMPIYRRVPFAVVLGLVDAGSEVIQTGREDHWLDLRAALAAARAVGITGKESE